MRSRPLWFLELFLIVAFVLALAGGVALAGHRSDHPSNLNDLITTPNFNYRVYYTNDNPPPATDADYFPTAQAQRVADALDTSDSTDPAFPGHHQLFLDMGFDAPYFSVTPAEVYIYDSSNLGGAFFSGIDIDAPSYVTASELDIRMVTGHELFHHVEYGYIDNGSISGCGGSWGKWTCEGMARAMQDKVYTDLDNDNGTTQASYIGELQSYLSSTGNLNTSLTNLSYKAALFWTYLSEQLGSVNAEPGRGVDVIEEYWSQANALRNSPDAMKALRNTLTALGSGRDLDELWLDYAIANVGKDLDLSSLADAAKYRYIDDNTATLSPSAAMSANAFFSSGMTSTGTLSVDSYAIRYLEGAPGAACGILGFRAKADEEAGFALLATTLLGQVERLFKAQTDDFAVALINRTANPYTDLYVVAAGLGQEADFDYTFACGDVDMQIIRPTSAYQAFVGESSDPDRFLVILNVVGPAELGQPSVQGLDISDFTVYVGAEDPADEAAVLSGAYVQGSYWLVVQAPTKVADGVYPLRARLGTLAAAAQQDAVVYGKEVLDQVLVIDASGSMNEPTGSTKLEAAKAAASLFVDASSDSDQLGVVWFSGNNVEPDDDAVAVHQLQAVLGNRNTAKTRIDAITPKNMTSIGDGLAKGQDQLDRFGTDPGRDVMVLLSDGMENEAALWSDVEGTITGRGTLVYTVALGPETDQARMQEIASATGGDYLYVDLSGASGAGTSAEPRATMSATAATSAAPSPSALTNRLSEAYRTINEELRRHQRIWQEVASVAAGDSYTFSIDINEGVQEAIFSFSWSEPDTTMSVNLQRPDGSMVTAGDPDVVGLFADDTHAVFQLTSLALGQWQARVVSPSNDQEVLGILSVRNPAGVQMDLYLGQPASSLTGGISYGFLFQAGVPMPIIVTLTDRGGPVLGAAVQAFIERPNGGVDVVELRDDGNHHDGRADDGIYAALYSKTAQGSTSGVTEDRRSGATPQRGSYIVRVEAQGQSNMGEPFQRLRTGAFHLFVPDASQEIGVDPDTDKDGLLDLWEGRFDCVVVGVLDGTQDADGDGMSNFQEMVSGTDPCDEDTDGGGEVDGSEADRGANPLDPSDDALPPPVDAEVFQANSDDSIDVELRPNANLIRFPASPGYHVVELWRSTSPTGGFSKVADIDPDTYRGMYYDEGLANGTTYYYKLRGALTSGARSRFSPVFSGTPRAQPYGPRGSVIINGGAPFTDSVDVTLSLSARYRLVVDGAPSDQLSDSGIMMMVSNSPDFVGASWEPLRSTVVWRLEPDPATGRAVVFAKFKGPDGAESIVETDGIIVRSASQLGALRGLAVLADRGDHSGILVTPVNAPAAPSVFTDASGLYMMAGLAPGTYDLLFSYPGYQDQLVTGVVVSGGSIALVPNVQLMPLAGGTPTPTPTPTFTPTPTPTPAVICAGVPATIVGTPGDDLLMGTDGPDVIAGLAGNDIIIGLGGDDLICAGGGQDIVSAGPGDDRVFGGPGPDRLHGGPGRDRLFGRRGHDVLNGGLGADRLFGGRGNDFLDGGRGKDVLFGGAHNDVLLGRGGDDKAWCSGGTDYVNGGPGQDVAGAACELVINVP